MQIIEPCYADPSLFVLADQLLIDDLDGAEYGVCPMAKAPEPVLRPTELWEGGDGKATRPVQQDPIDGTVLFEPATETFHLWYRTHNNLMRSVSSREHSRVPSGSGVAYATSDDGLNWVRPQLRRVAFEQSLDNNLLRVAVPPVRTNHISGVVPNYSGSHDCALLATVYSHYEDPVYPMGITFLTSNDGIDWSPHWPPPLPLDGDAHCLMWDWHRQCYICTTRSYVHQHEIRRLQMLHGQHQLRNKRHIAVARSRDLVHWTPMLPVLEVDGDDPDNAQMYFMYIIPYGHGYVGLVQMFYMSADMTYGPLEMQLTFSRDLINWQRPGERAPILPRGPAGSWDQSHVSVTTNPPHPEGDRLRFWYGGKDTEHWQSGNGALGTATLRRDGFACCRAGDAWATVTTVPLELNWSTKPMVSADAAGGELRVEILDAESLLPLEGTARDDCLPITADGTQLPVCYGPRRGTFVRHTGAVRFRFHMRRARLYAFKAPNCVLAGQRAREENAWL